MIALTFASGAAVAGAERLPWKIWERTAVVPVQEPRIGAVVADTSGSVFIGGRSSALATSQGFLVKLDPAGVSQLLPITSAVTHLAWDTAGNLLVASRGPAQPSGQLVTVTRLSPGGSILWSATIGNLVTPPSAPEDWPVALVASPEGSVYVAVHYQAAAAPDPGDQVVRLRGSDGHELSRTARLAGTVTGLIREASGRIVVTTYLQDAVYTADLLAPVCTFEGSGLLGDRVGGGFFTASCGPNPGNGGAQNLMLRRWDASCGAT